MQARGTRKRYTLRERRLNPAAAVAAVANDAPRQSIFDAVPRDIRDCRRFQETGARVFRAYQCVRMQKNAYRIQTRVIRSDCSISLCVRQSVAREREHEIDTKHIASLRVSLYTEKYYSAAEKDIIVCFFSSVFDNDYLLQRRFPS